jgi:hypothetical protein
LLLAGIARLAVGIGGLGGAVGIVAVARIATVAAAIATSTLATGGIAAPLPCVGAAGLAAWP